MHPGSASLTIPGLPRQRAVPDCVLTVPNLPNLPLPITDQFSGWLCHISVCSITEVQDGLS